MGSAQIGFERAMKPFAIPLGLASPMWLAYGAAASMGATWWWMSRLTRFAAPALSDAAPADPAPAIVAAVATVAELPVEVAATIVETAEIPMEKPVEAAPAVVESAVEQPDELTLLRGVGPRVADALVARGVTTFAQLAAWSEEELAAFDAQLKLLGRSKRYDFLGQARALAE
jgi:predicted flap endonuclease-1-like 5' DNA nuclease